MAQSKWIKVQTDLIDDMAAYKMSGDEFRKEFIAAARGETSKLSMFVRPDIGKGRLPEKQWSAIRLRIFKRDNWTCTYCGKRGRLECDHIIPVSRGGSNKDDNLVTACRSCNRDKRDRTPEEWRAARGQADAHV